MNFKKFKASLTFRKYNNSKIILRYVEYKIKNFFLDLLVKLNIFKFNSRKIIDLGSFRDNSYINYFLFSLKDEYSDIEVIKEKISNLEDLFKRGHKYKIKKNDDHLPEYMIKNKKIFIDYF